MLNKAQISIITLAVFSLFGLYFFTDNYVSVEGQTKNEANIKNNDLASDIDSIVTLVLSKMTKEENDSVNHIIEAYPFSYQAF